MAGPSKLTYCACRYPREVRGLVRSASASNNQVDRATAKYLVRRATRHCDPLRAMLKNRSSVMEDVCIMLKSIASAVLANLSVNRLNTSQSSKHPIVHVSSGRRELGCEPADKSYCSNLLNWTKSAIAKAISINPTTTAMLVGLCARFESDLGGASHPKTTF